MRLSHYNAVDPQAADQPPRRELTRSLTHMSIKKIRVALLWAAMVAAMVMSSGVASASGGWG